MPVCQVFAGPIKIVLNLSLTSELPSSPGAVTVTRNCATSIVVSWAASREVKQLVGYYIEYSVVGSEAWVPSNNKPVKSTRSLGYTLPV